jgi:PhzF family phenazine biosynthesis protein
MNVERLAAFADGASGGNPAGVVIGERLPGAAEMQAIAAEVGYSETAFAAPEGGGWRVRYFAPAIEVPFCGHATIALGAALAARFGDARFDLTLNDGAISVEGARSGDDFTAALQSPPTRSSPAPTDLVAAALDLFGYQPGDLDARIPPAIAEAGARHLVLGLKSRELLAAMRYELDRGRELMEKHALTTICLICAESPRLFHARNAFAIGGVVEDPATGAASAALGGYLRDLSWPHQGRLEIVQGEDMGMRSRITVEITPKAGESIRVSGAVRSIA